MKTVEIHTTQKNRGKASEMQTVEMKTLPKNRGRASEMQTVEMKTLQKIGIRFLKCKLLR